MTGYIKRLSYADALRAVTLINDFVSRKLEEPDLSVHEKASWENASANITSGAVKVVVDSVLQVHILNVVLDDNDCGHIDFERPFVLRSKEEKDGIIDTMIAPSKGGIVQKD